MMDAGILTGISTLILAVLAIVTKVLHKDRSNFREDLQSLKADHRDCMRKHEECTEERLRDAKLIGGLEASVRTLASYHGRQAESAVDHVLQVAKTDAERAAVESRDKSGHSKPKI